MVCAGFIKVIMVPWEDHSHWILEGPRVVKTRQGGAKRETREARLASFGLLEHRESAMTSSISISRGQETSKHYNAWWPKKFF